MKAGEGFLFTSFYFILFYKLNNVLSGSLPDLPSENTMINKLLLQIPAGVGGGWLLRQIESYNR